MCAQANPLFTGKTVSSIWKAVRQLNPDNVKKEAERHVKIGILASNELLQVATEYIVGNNPADYDRAADNIILVTIPPEPPANALLSQCDILLRSSDYKQKIPGISERRTFDFSSREELAQVIKKILDTKELQYALLPLARLSPVFRTEVVNKTILTISVENAIFVTSTSLGNIIPNPLQPLTALAEAMGDIVVLTANQIRMLYRLAAAYGKDVSLKEQAPEALSIIGTAFGWRAISRELVGNIPFGGGIIPKATIAYAGTWAIGDGLSYFFNTGVKLTKDQVKERFNTAMEKSKKAAEDIVLKMKDTYDKNMEKLSKSRQQTE